MLVVNKWTANEKSRGDEVGSLGLCDGEGEGLSGKQERVRKMERQEKSLTTRVFGFSSPDFENFFLRKKKSVM